MGSAIRDLAVTEDPVVTVLRSVPPFAALPVEALHSLAAAAHRRRMCRGSRSFAWAIRATHSGSSALWARAGEGASPDGREFTLHVAGPGEAPGHLDLSDRHPRPADAVAPGRIAVQVVAAALVALVAPTTASAAFSPGARKLTAIVKEGMAGAAPARRQRRHLDSPSRHVRALLRRRGSKDRPQAASRRSFPDREHHQDVHGDYFLGVIIEQVTGLALPDAIRTQILEPLGLGETSYPTTTTMPAPFARGHYAGPEGEAGSGTSRVSTRRSAGSPAR